MLPSTMIASYKRVSAQPTNRPALNAGSQGASASSIVTTNGASVTADQYAIVLVHTTRNGGSPDTIVSISDTVGTPLQLIASILNTAVSTQQHRLDIYGGKIPSTNGSNATQVTFSGSNGAKVVQGMTFNNVNLTEPISDAIQTAQNDSSSSVALSATISTSYNNSLAVAITADIGNFANVTSDGGGWTLFSNVQSGSPSASSTWWSKNMSAGSKVVGGDAGPNQMLVAIPLKGT